MTGLYGVTNANLYGDHTNSNMAVFTQFDYSFLKRFSASLGLRWETYSLDDTDKESAPVMRAGLNFRAASYTFLRASFGQGYRYPSIAEKYTATSLGSLNIFPNPGLKPESGWSAEVGVKQGFKIGSWKGFADVAGFWTEYEDMIEYTFGIWLEDSTQIPTLDDLGFKSLNVGYARINGVEFDITGTGTFGKYPVTFFAGYTYMNPVDLSSDTLENRILKYRYRHSVKGSMELSLKRFTFGISFIYNSFMERIDEAFEEKILGQEIFPRLKEYREKNNKGHFVLDLRASYRILEALKVSLILNNIFNEEYMGRPGDIQPPANIALQCVLKI
jgi:iron complex outermembrane receptor protein